MTAHATSCKNDNVATLSAVPLPSNNTSRAYTESRGSSMTETRRTDIRSLLERARFDIEQGWTEAAYDALGQALGILVDDVACAEAGAGTRPGGIP